MREILLVISLGIMNQLCTCSAISQSKTQATVSPHAVPTSKQNIFSSKKPGKRFPFAFHTYRRVESPESDWEALFQAANRLQLENSGNRSNNLRVIVYLRRALLTADKEHAPPEDIAKIRNNLADQYEKLHAVKLADWYRRGDFKEITKRLEEKNAEGKRIFLKDWRIRMDEFGLITIWKTDTVAPRSKPVFRYYRPMDEDYSEVLLMSKIQPQTEKSVDFDLSVFSIALGPSYSVNNPSW